MKIVKSPLLRMLLAILSFLSNHIYLPNFVFTVLHCYLFNAILNWKHFNFPLLNFYFIFSFEFFIFINEIYLFFIIFPSFVLIFCGPNHLPYVVFLCATIWTDCLSFYIITFTHFLLLLFALLFFTHFCLIVGIYCTNFTTAFCIIYIIFSLIF